MLFAWISMYFVSAGVVQMPVVLRELKMEGFLVWRWMDDRWMEGIMHMLQLIEDGKLKYKETVAEGFENMFEAFIDMLTGGNVGKAVVKAWIVKL